MERWQNRVAVVTGASSGIGEAIAKDLVAAGLRVVALGRRQQRLEENRSKLSKSEQARYFPKKCDVTNEEEVKKIFEWVEKTLGGTDILVNNAGLIRQGNLVDMDTKLVDEVINTNIKGLLYCTQAAYKSMAARKFDGHIVHINSVAGHSVFQVVENTSANIYPPSKFAVTAMNEIFRNELRNLGTRIKTTSVSPGAVLTEIITKEALDAFGNILKAEDISQAVLFAISTPPHVQIHEITVKPIGEKF